MSNSQKETKCAWCRQSDNDLKPMRVTEGIVDVCGECRWKSAKRRPPESKPKYAPHQAIFPFMQGEYTHD